MMQPTTELQWLPTTTATMLDAGSLYIEHGLRVVIVHGIKDDGSCTCGKPKGACKPGKHPVLGAWQKKIYATVADLVDALTSKRTPQPHNIGIVLGEQLDGQYIIAIDNDNAARMAELEAAIGALPATLTTRSGGGGSHRLYALGPGQDPRRMANRTGVRLDTEEPTPGVDVKVAGGQIVVCPSLHASGDRYSWAIAAPLAALPRAWFDLIAEPIEAPKPHRAGNVIQFGDKYLESVIENNCKDIAGRGKGERNSVFWTKTCTVLEHCAGAGASFSRALPHLRNAGLACGLPKHEVDDVLRKAERHVRSTGKTRTPSSPAPGPKARTSSTPGASSPSGAEPSIAADVAGDEEWMNQLARNKQGGIKSTLGNAVLVLRHDEVFKGRVSFNRMRVAPCLDGRPLRDADLARFRVEMEERWGFAPGSETMADAVVLVGDDRSFHPVQDYLSGLVWDGEGRIARVAAEVLGISRPDAMTHRVLRAWFVSAVARALSPGCKVDTTLVLAGPQGFKKSTFFATLGGEWFTDTYVDVRSKDGLLQVHAAWIYEWGEIERVTTRTSSSDVKAFLTSRRDDVRPPYGRGIISQDRSGVVVGTTNKPFLDDETGSRRFHPVKVEQMVNVDVLRAWRDQLWAEAVAAFKAGEAWWLTEDEDRAREDAADDHMVENPWLEKIASYVSDPSRQQYGVTVADVLVGALGIDLGRVQRGEETRVGKALKRLRWWSRQETRGAARIRVHYPRAAQPSQPEPSVSGAGCADDESENIGSTQPAQHTQHTRAGESESVGEVSHDAGDVSEKKMCDRGAKLETACAGYAGRAATTQDAEMTTGVFRANHEVVQQSEPRLSEWLAEQGIGTPNDD